LAGQSSGFGKEKRLLNAKDYSRVFDNPDARASHQNVLLLAKINDRLAVHRNRIKRVAREFLRTRPAGESAVDVVLLARRGIGDLDNAELSSILQQQWKKLIHQTTKMILNNSQDS
jgi:ribonuclease P protein component